MCMFCVCMRVLQEAEGGEVKRMKKLETYVRDLLDNKRSENAKELPLEALDLLDLDAFANQELEQHKVHARGAHRRSRAAL
jgi:hypothetical protein